MSNDYVTGLLIQQRHDDLRQEAAEDRLGRIALRNRPRPQHWWDRLMLFRTTRTTRTTRAAGAARATHRPAATAVASDSPC